MVTGCRTSIPPRDTTYTWGAVNVLPPGRTWCCWVYTPPPPPCTCGPVLLSQPAVMKPAWSSSLFWKHSSFSTDAADITRGGVSIWTLRDGDGGQRVKHYHCWGEKAAQTVVRGLNLWKERWNFAALMTA